MRARADWRRLRDDLTAIPPKAIGRGLLALAVAGAGVWVAIATWPALLPFAIGALIAYAVLPIVNAMDTVMPRAFAAIVAVVVVLAALVALLVVLIPPFARGIGLLAQELPSRGEVAAWIASVEGSLGELPGPAGPQLAALMDGVVTAVRDALSGSTTDLSDLGPTIIQAFVSAVATALGLIVLPAWMLTVMREQRKGRSAVLSSAPGWLRGDAWAVVRIIDRVAASYIRGGVPLGLLVGGGVWLGLGVAERIGVSTFEHPEPLAVFAGAMQIIPEIGPIVGFLPALLILPISAERALTYLVVYIVSRWAAGTLMGRRVGGRRRLHPVILIPGIVALSQFGLAWLFLAGPMLAIAYDLVRYAHGRLSDPARPAGLIPDEVPSTRSSRVVRSTPQERAMVIGNA